MKTKVLNFFILFCFTFLSVSVKAQTMLVNEASDSATTIAKTAQVRKCLTPAIIGTNKVSLTGSEMPTNEKMYIVDCMPTANNFVCTTGSKTWDDLLNITATNPQSFSVDQGNPYILTKGVLNLTANVQMDSGATHFFVATILIDTSALDAQSKSIKLATFNFNDQDLNRCISANTPTPDTSEVSANNPGASESGGGPGGEGGDPYGRIFDAKSLEPIPNVSISILDQNKQTLNVPLLVNPQIVKNDGVFNFVVAPGTYYLNPRIPSGYTFANATSINSNYTKAYSQILSSPNEAVVEKSIKNPEHRDIALDPGKNAPFRSTPTKIDYGTMRNGTDMVVLGRVSHPLSIIEFVQGSKVIGKTIATKYGVFKVTIKNNLIRSDVPIDVSITKVDLTSNGNLSTKNNTIFDNLFISLKSIINPQAFAAVSNKSSFTIDPIPSYLEGLAYDKSSSVVPNAEVYIKLKNSNRVYYQTTADEKGNFKISPSNLPVFAYSIEIKNPKTNAITKQTITEFANKNKEYLIDNKINLITAVKNGKSLIGKIQTSNVKNQTNNTATPTSEKKLKAMEDPNSILFTILVLFAIMIVIGVTLYFLYKNNAQNKDDRILF
jgi:hypothetical protein